MFSIKNLLLILFISSLVGCFNETPTDDELNKDNNSTSYTDIELLSLDISKNQDNASLYNKRAILYLKKDNYSKALNDINIAITIDSLNINYYHTLSDIYLNLGKGEECLKLLNKLSLIYPKSSSNNIKIGQFYLYYKNFDNSIKYLNKAIAIDKINPEAYFTKGLLYQHDGDTNKALNYYNIAIEQKPDFFDAHLQSAIIHSVRRSQLSEHYYNNALKIKPKNINALYGKAIYYQETNQIDKAINGYQSLLSISENNEKSLYNLGYIYMIYKDNLDSAKIFFNKAIKNDSNYFDAYYNLGLCYELQYNNKEAINYYKKILSLKPDYTNAIEGLNRTIKH